MTHSRNEGNRTDSHNKIVDRLTAPAGLVEMPQGTAPAPLTSLSHSCTAISACECMTHNRSESNRIDCHYKTIVRLTASTGLMEMPSETAPALLTSLSSLCSITCACESVTHSRSESSRTDSQNKVVDRLTASTRLVEVP